MKFRKTYKFAFYSAILLSILSLILVVVLSYVLQQKVTLLFVLLFELFLFAISFLIIQYRVEHFIYRGIQKIYKNVSSLEKNELDKNTITSDMETLSKNVQLFAEKKHLEIEILKEREIYRREFLGNISHELKTPIFTIQGYLLTLLEGAINDENIRLKYLERANNGVERLNHIVKDLDMISKLEIGDLNISYTSFNLINLIENVFDLLEMEAKKRTISLSFIRFYETPILVDADKDRIQQVLINLMVNAIYYGKSGGNVIISIDLHTTNNKVIIAIKDDGNGIEDSNIPRLFERFYRVDKSRARNQGGTGLGLSIVKHIIEAHNEEVFVESKLNVGSTFSFTLKLIN